MASALITVPCRPRASAIASADLPLAVGPVMTMTRSEAMAGGLFSNPSRRPSRPSVKNVLFLISSPPHPPLNRGATLVATMKQHGATCALVSGGFTYFTALVRQALGFDFDAANTLKHDGRTLSGAVETPILGKEAKLATLERLGAERGLPIADTMIVGDGANDLPMLKAAGLGVAYHAKPAVAAKVSARIDH